MAAALARLCLDVGEMALADTGRTGETEIVLALQPLQRGEKLERRSGSELTLMSSSRVPWCGEPGGLQAGALVLRPPWRRSPRGPGSEATRVVARAASWRSAAARGRAHSQPAQSGLELAIKGDAHAPASLAAAQRALWRHGAERGRSTSSPSQSASCARTLSLRLEHPSNWSVHT